jgi:hypothetical protein
MKHKVKGRKLQYKQKSAMLGDLYCSHSSSVGRDVRIEVQKTSPGGKLQDPTSTSKKLGVVTCAVYRR